MISGGPTPGPYLSGPDLVEALRGVTGATAPRLRQLLHIARNSASHYEKPHSPELAVALRSLGSTGQTVEVTIGPTMAQVRATFADVVATELAFGSLNEHEYLSLLGDLTTTILAIIHLADTASALRFADQQARSSRTPL